MRSALDRFRAMVYPVVDQASDLRAFGERLVFAVVPGASVLEGEVCPLDRGGVCSRGSGLIPASYVVRVSSLLDESRRGIQNGEIILRDYPFRVVTDAEEKLASLKVKGGDVARGTSWGGWGGEFVSENVTVFMIGAGGEAFGSVGMGRYPMEIEGV